MPEGYENIDGHRYWVERDDEGNIVRQLGADPPPTPKPPHPIVGRARTIVRGYHPVDNPLTPRQRDELSVFLVRSSLRELRDDG